LKGPIQSVEVTYLIHATEDKDRVDSAVKELVSTQAEPVAEEMEGHFGNKIVRVRFHLTGDDAASAFEGIVRHLPPGLKSELEREMGAHLDEHSALFLRLDKQRLVSGVLEAGSPDPIRVKVKPRRFLIKGDAREFYLKLLTGGALAG
jgi:RNA binding exosome subunit